MFDLIEVKPFITITLFKVIIRSNHVTQKKYFMIINNFEGKENSFLKEENSFLFLKK